MTNQDYTHLLTYYLLRPTKNSIKPVKHPWFVYPKPYNSLLTARQVKQIQGHKAITILTRRPHRKTTTVIALIDHIQPWPLKQPLGFTPKPLRLVDLYQLNQDQLQARRFLKHHRSTPLAN